MTLAGKRGVGAVAVVGFIKTVFRQPTGTTLCEKLKKVSPRQSVTNPPRRSDRVRPIRSRSVHPQSNPAAARTTSTAPVFALPLPDLPRRRTHRSHVLLRGFQSILSRHSSKRARRQWTL